MVDQTNPFKKDRYGGIEIQDMSLLPETEADFEQALDKWLVEWEEQGVRSVQVQFCPPKCHLMNVAFKKGFFFHHAHQKKGYVLMILWMDKKVPCRMPPYADHYIGIGGAVLNQIGEILLIKENRSLDQRRWKLPGGFMNPQERLADAVVREVKEETGVKAEFCGLVGLRETLNYKYNASDFYFCAVLVCDTTQGVAIEDTQEVQTAAWVSLDKITDSNSETDPPEIFMFQTPFEYVRRIKVALAQRPEGKDLREFLEETFWKEHYNPVLQGMKQDKFNFYFPKM